MNTVLLAMIITAAGLVAALVYVLTQSRTQTSRVVADRLRQIGGAEGRLGGGAREAAAGERQYLPTVEKLMAGAGFTQKLMDQLGRAGWRIKPSEYVGIALGSVGVGAILLMTMTHSPLGGLIGASIGYIIPRTMLNMAVGRRKAALEGQIGDMVMLVSSALRSGYSFLRALQVVAREMPAPISEVAKRVGDECQLGVPLEDALTRMSQRVQSYDMGLVTTAVIIQSQVGGSLAEVLEAIGDTIRERVQLQGEVNSLTAEGKLSGIVLMLLTPAMAGALTVMNPGYISILISDPAGIKMIIGAVMLQILGLVWIKRMMRIEI